MSVLSSPHFHHEKAAYDYVEARLWPDGPFCPHCGECERIGRLTGKSTRIGVRKCYSCRKPFTVKVGTVFEASHVPMRHWLQAMFLMASSKKGVSANQLHRTLGCTLKTAWFIEHRIREAMTAGALAPFGSDGGAVEADETYIGVNPDKTRARFGPAHKNAILTILDRDTGRISSEVLENAPHELSKALVAKVSRKARLMTDQSPHYSRVGWTFSEHGAVNHGKGEYVSAEDPTVHINTVEGSFSIFKRGMKGVYQHCARKHLPRYLAEFDFRYSNRKALGVDDVTRADEALRGVRGKRLTYQRVSARREGEEARVVW